MKRILVGVDGSDTSKQALRWAVDNAGEAEVVALHVYDVPLPIPDAAPGHPVNFAEIVTETHEGAVRFVTSIVDEVVGDQRSGAGRSASKDIRSKCCSRPLPTRICSCSVRTARGAPSF